MAYLYLALAILMEVIATTALKSSDGFTRLWPSLLAALGYALAFYGLALCLRTLPVGIAYALWSGLGIVLVTLLAWWVHDQHLSPVALLGMGLITLGVLVIQLGGVVR